MKINEIEVGKTYYSGSGGRFETQRIVLETDVRMSRFDGTDTPQLGVRFKQIKGPHKGIENTITLNSFASWAKGVKSER